ncbi:hypothetical protein [Mucilaginibacter rubeus]|uniref:Uncharacterized protein n=1 Tax=Mucilaginibacter rubeus TaxID=2027860 RepID=A0A5C1I1D4_9SPHI|nr:hypothetical protein [Mucilaginibacter rubeus]QEM11723.1 hypothetical protein DEO27_017380 [Mucilaginibacter rubeus]
MYKQSFDPRFCFNGMNVIALFLQMFIELINNPDADVLGLKVLAVLQTDNLLRSANPKIMTETFIMKLSNTLR